MKERLQKILARAGHGSRRSAEALITSGRVAVNGVVVRELGAQADAALDTVTLDGLPVQRPEGRVYLALYKPFSFVTTVRDERGRHTVMELLPAVLPPGVVPVGRLDRDTEGLLLFTNDGELAHRLAHPRYVIDKEYCALVHGTPSSHALARLRGGVIIDGKPTSPAEVEILTAPSGYDAEPAHTWLKIVIHEGRKRQVRQMCDALGHPVRRLVRTRVGGITLGRLRKGKTRRLSEREVYVLLRLVGL